MLTQEDSRHPAPFPPEDSAPVWLPEAVPLHVISLLRASVTQDPAGELPIAAICFPDSPKFKVEVLAAQ